MVSTAEPELGTARPQLVFSFLKVSFITESIPTICFVNIVAKEITVDWGNLNDLIYVHQFVNILIFANKNKCHKPVSRIKAGTPVGSLDSSSWPRCA